VDVKYKANADDVRERLRLFLDERVQDRVFATLGVPSAALAEFRRTHDDGFCEYPDPQERAAFWDALLAERTALEDDSIPSAYLSEFDQGLYGGVFGGDVRFLCDTKTGWISSMVPPLLDDWSGFDALQFDEDHPWFQKYKQQLAVFVERAAGKFGISHMILVDSFNFVFELVGAADTYLAMIDRPETVRRAINFAFDLNVRIHDTFFEMTGADECGTFSNMIQWHAGRIVNESIDPFHMTSAADFEAWGVEPVQRIFDRYDGGCLHIHGNGRHLLESACSIRGLKAIYMGDDKGYPPTIDVLPELKGRAGDTPLVVLIDYDRFTELLGRHSLSGGVMYNVSGAPDIAAANRCMEQVRDYRA
jgi:hypothetical protein